MSNFTWIPSYGSELSQDTRVRRVKFGDGYSQESPDGLNAQPEVYNLVFDKRKATEAAEIAAFLRERASVCGYFTFTPPTQISGRNPAVTKKFKCYSFKQIPDQFDSVTITAVFEETFEI